MDGLCLMDKNGNTVNINDYGPNGQVIVTTKEREQYFLNFQQLCDILKEHHDRAANSDGREENE